MGFSLKVLKDEEHPLLSRREIEAELSFSGPTPSRAELIQKLSSELECKPELISIENVSVKFGDTQGLVYARVYMTEQEMKKIEPEHLIKRSQPKKQEAEQEGSQEDQGAKPEEKSKASESGEKTSQESQQSPKESKADTKKAENESAESKS